MKKIHFILQSKGGAGKSFLTYLLALKEEANEKALFVELDSSTKSSTKNLRFLAGRTPARFAELSLLDDRRKIVRDKLIAGVEGLNKLEGYESIYCDCGAPESEQFPALVSYDLKAKDLKDFADYLGVKFVFHIVVAGGTSYVSCVDYMQQLVSNLGGLFEIYIEINETTFYGFSHLLEEVKSYASDKKNKITAVRNFGDIDITSDIGKSIMANIEQGNGFDELPFAAKLKMRNEFEKIA